MCIHFRVQRGNSFALRVSLLKKRCRMKSPIVSALLLGSLALPGVVSAQTLRAGIIGCDTSHVPAFTKVINAPDAKGALARIEVVVAYPGGSPDLAASRDRVEGYTKELRAAGVEIVDSIEQLMEQC